MGVGTIMKTNQYLTFKLGNETYAFDVGNAREILECTTITQIPDTPPWIRGVINLRGNVVPVLDLKLKFGMGQTERTINTCIIIVESMLGSELSVSGILADSVQEVFELDAAQIEPPPKLGTRLSTQYIRGMGRHAEQLFIILSAEKVFSGAEVTAAQDALESAQWQPGDEGRESEPDAAAAADAG